ncbi:MAG: sulfatase/phosphatase domain-containing protein, partial [bacterium]
VRWETRFSSPELYQKSVKGYYRLISGVDQAVGRILSLLETLNLLDNTVILFTSDNGFFLGEKGLAGKWLMYEESIRTPLLIWDPRLPEDLRGKRRPEMTLNVDIAPTLLALAGVDVPLSMQGRDLVPLTTGKSIPWRTEWFYDHLFVHQRIPKTEGIRTERWKYIRYIDQDPIVEELYDLQSDSLEERNLVGSRKHLGTLDKMRARHQAWIGSFDAWRLDTPVPWEEPE